MRICIYEDQRTSQLEPLTLTRPASDLLCGLDSLGEKQARYFGAEVVGYLCRPQLVEVLRERYPSCPVNDPGWLRSAPTVLVNARWLPPMPAGPRRAPASRRRFVGGSSFGTCRGETAFAALDSGYLQTLAPETIEDCLADFRQSLPSHDAGGTLVEYAWDLIEANPDQMERDFTALCSTGDRGHHPTSLVIIGPADRLFVHPSARIDPMVVADTSRGPVWIGPNAVVTSFTRLEGPCAIGAGTQLFGAKIRTGTTIGPQCRIGGEVECSIVQGFTNKYHDGFLGHSFVGEWVNLAAGTITGDLRFDYQSIAMRVSGRRISTGRLKLGSIIGDHARTGLSVLLDCGTTIGAFASLLPTGRYSPREVASFTRYGPEGTTLLTDLEAVLKGAAAAMQRRGKGLTPALEKLYQATAGDCCANSLVPVPDLRIRKSA